MKMLVFIAVIAMVSGCVDIPVIGGIFNPSTEVVGKTDILTIENAKTTPSGNINSGSDFTLSFDVVNNSNDVINDVIIDLYDAPTVKNQIGDKCNSGKNKCTPNGFTCGEEKECIIDVLAPGAKKLVYYELKAPTNEEINNLIRPIEMKYRIYYSFENASSAFSVNIFSKDYIRTLQQSNESPKAGSIPQTIGPGPLKAEISIRNADYFVAGNPGSFEFMITEKGDGRVKDSKVKSLAIELSDELNYCNDSQISSEPDEIETDDTENMDVSPPANINVIRKILENDFSSNPLLKGFEISVNAIEECTVNGYGSVINDDNENTCEFYGGCYEAREGTVIGHGTYKERLIRDHDNNNIPNEDNYRYLGEFSSEYPSDPEVYMDDSNMNFGIGECKTTVKCDVGYEEGMVSDGIPKCVESSTEGQLVCWKRSYKTLEGDFIQIVKSVDSPIGEYTEIINPTPKEMDACNNDKLILVMCDEPWEEDEGKCICPPLTHITKDSIPRCVEKEEISPIASDFENNKIDGDLIGDISEWELTCIDRELELKIIDVESHHLIVRNNQSSNPILLRINEIPMLEEGLPSKTGQVEIKFNYEYEIFGSTKATIVAEE